MIAGINIFSVEDMVFLSIDNIDLLIGFRREKMEQKRDRLQRDRAAEKKFKEAGTP